MKMNKDKDKPDRIRLRAYLDAEQWQLSILDSYKNEQGGDIRGYEKEKADCKELIEAYRKEITRLRKKLGAPVTQIIR